MENSRLGERLKTLRKIKKYSQQEVADYLKVIRQTYSHYETGRIIPTYKNFMKLAELYGISVNSLIELTDMGENEDVARTDFSKLSDEEWKLVNYYRMMDQRDKTETIWISKMKAEREENFNA